MSTALVCSRCGFANPMGAKFCARCAERLTATMQTQATPGTQVGPQPAWYESTQPSQVTRTGIDRTQTGLLLLIIGILLGPIPYLNYLGGILSIVGAIMVILGREVFGPRHSRFVILSLVLYIVGLVIIVVNTVGLIFSLFSAGLVGGSPGAIGQVFSDGFNQFLIGSIVASAITGIAVLLFTYALQRSSGKLLLWTGYVASLAISILVFFIISQDITSVVQQATSTSPPNTLALVASLQALQGQIQVFSLLGLVPATVDATAYYLVWSRIRRGELPPPAKQVAPVLPGTGLGTPSAK